MPDYQILTTSVVYLFEAGSIQRLTLQPRELSEVLSGQVTGGQTLDGRVILSSIADQVEVILGADRLDVRDLSGRPPGEKTSVAHIVLGLVGLLGGMPRASGFNYELAYETPGGKPSSEFLKEKFLIQDGLIDTLGVTGAAVTLYLSMDERRVTLRLEPRWQDPASAEVFVNVNAHSALPPGYENAKALDEALDSTFHALQHSLEQLFGV